MSKREPIVLETEAWRRAVTAIGAIAALNDDEKHADYSTASIERRIELEALTSIAASLAVIAGNMDRGG